MPTRKRGRKSQVKINKWKKARKKWQDVGFHSKWLSDRQHCWQMARNNKQKQVTGYKRQVTSDKARGEEGGNTATDAHQRQRGPFKENKLVSQYWRWANIFNKYYQS